MEKLFFNRKVYFDIPPWYQIEYYLAFKGWELFRVDKYWREYYNPEDKDWYIKFAVQETSLDYAETLQASINDLAIMEKREAIKIMEDIVGHKGI